MPARPRPARAAEAPRDVVALAERAGEALLAELLLRTPGAASAALVLVPPICTAREAGLATWRISVNLDVVVPDKGARDAREA